MIPRGCAGPVTCEHASYLLHPPIVFDVGDLSDRSIIANRFVNTDVGIRANGNGRKVGDAEDLFCSAQIMEVIADSEE